MARPYPYDDSLEALLRPASRYPFFESWTDRDTDDENLLCAEMSRLAYADEGTVARSLEIPGFSLVHWFGAESVLSRIATRGTDGFVARHRTKPITVVAFRGTEATKPEDLFLDLLTGSVPWGDGHVHQGFAMAYEPVRRPLQGALAKREANVLFTGHSLGAALATLAAAEHPPEGARLITFGSPRVGDHRFKAMLGDQRTVRRFVNCCDVVTRVPPERFEEDRIRAVLEDVTGPNVVARGVALVMSTLLSRSDGGPEFVHVAPARYADAEGTTIREGVDDERDPIASADRAQARQRFRPRRHSPGFSERRSFEERLRSLSTDPFGAVSEGLADMVDALKGTPVPVRDLADHAPINYVSLWTGRLRSAAAGSEGESPRA